MDSQNPLPQINSLKRLNKLTAYLKTDRAILMVCIGIAFVFWLFTKLSYTYRSTLSIRLEYSVSKDRVLALPPPDQIDIQLEGSGWDLLKLYFVRKKYLIDVDVTDNNPKTLNSAALKAKLLRQLPENVSILDLSPDNLQFKPEALAKKKIPVYIDNQLQLSAQFILSDSLSAYPDSIEIQGPVSIVKDISSWQTVPFNQSGIESSFIKKLALKKHENRNVIFIPDEIDVEGKIEQVTEKTLEVEVIKTGVPDTLLLVLLPQRINVSCIVGLSDFDILSAKDFRVTADFSKFNIYDRTSVKLELEDYPGFVRKIKLQPKEVDYIIRSKK